MLVSCAGELNGNQWQMYFHDIGEHLLLNGSTIAQGLAVTKLYD